MNKVKKKVVWFCGLPEKTRVEAFSDLKLPPQCTWSWVVGHLPPPADIDLHIVCGDRRLGGDVTRTWNGATFHLVKVLRGGPFMMYESWAPAFVRKSRELHPDVVHGWGTECAFGLAALRAAPARCLIGIQGILAEFWPFMPKNINVALCTLNELRVLKKVKWCVAESDYSKAAVSKYTKASVSIVPHPLREEFRNATLGPRNEKIIIYLGSLDRRKGFLDALKAFDALDTDWKLVCIGEALSARQQAKIDRFIEGTTNVKQIVLTGRQTSAQITDWFRRSPLFFLPSYADTGPTALKEALAMGLWPVCYDNTGPQELIGKYGAGSLVPTGDIQKLKETLEQVLVDQPWRNTVRMERVSQAIRADMSPGRIWEMLDSIYGKIIGSRSSCV